VEACPVAIALVLLCAAGSVWFALADARTEGFILSPGCWTRRWPLLLLGLAAAIGVGLARIAGC